MQPAIHKSDGPNSHQDGRGGEKKQGRSPLQKLLRREAEDAILPKWRNW